MPKTEIAELYGSSIFNFLQNLVLLSIVAAPIYNPNNSSQGFPFVHIFINTCFLQRF